ncbi:MAG: tetratricopeptide repeat protein [Planctomycetia bacterium]|nr:tetratricopeptide repeat protein [Planctomycetia bacterium]
MSSIAETLAQAKAYQISGQLRHAEQFYLKVLHVDSANVDALYLLGTACDSLGKPHEAIANLQQAVRLKPDHADAHHHLGTVLARQGELDAAIASFQQAWRLKPGSTEVFEDLRNAQAARENRRGNALAEAGNLDEAETCYRRALELRPNYVAAQGNLGNVLKNEGRLNEAAACYRRVLELKQESTEAHYNLGLISEEQKKVDEAVDWFRRTLKLKPDFAEAHNRLGALLADQGKFEEAVACFRRVLELTPDLAEAHNFLGAALSEQGKHEEAVACFGRALELKPDFGEAHNLLGVALLKQGKFEEAEACLRRALELEPEFGEALNHLAAALSEQAKFDEALACLERALELQPDNAAAHNNLGTFLERKERLNEAIACFGRAVELNPDFAEARVGRGLALLLMGRFAEGWPEYEWRWKCKGLQEPVLQKPHWTGATLAAARILLHSEQGFGDTLQFVRYAELVKERCGTVIVQCQSPLARLLTSCPGVDTVVATGDPLPEFDFHAPLLSLPGVFGTSLEDIPAKVPYLWPNAELVERRNGELGKGSALKIGIAWQGKAAYAKDRFRSIPLAQFEGIVQMRGVCVYSLQTGAGRGQLTNLGGQLPITDLGDRLGDFHDTAAIVRNLDLVITCDSAPAHLAGSLGVPVWVALSFGPDWRWLLERSDSPWYPTMRLFRQSRPGDWNDVFRAIESELAKLVKTHCPASTEPVDQSIS